MKHSIIIPTINQTRLLLDCIIAFRKYERESDYEIIIVDDGSEESVRKWTEKTFGRDEDVSVVYSPKNMGYAHSVNLGLKQAIGDNLVIMNNDIQIMKPFLRFYEEAYGKDERMGVIGAKLLYPPGDKIQHAGLVHIPGSKMFVHANKHRIRSCIDANISKYFITVTGALYAVRRETWEDVGDWNENYFLSCEDTDYSLRCWIKDWHVYYSHRIEAIHFEGHTRGNNPIAKRQKGLEWYEKEIETIGKFDSDLNSYDLRKIGAMVRKMNRIAHEAGDKYTSGSILVKRNAAIGDVILTTGVIRRLREVKGNGVTIDVATSCKMVFENNPYVNNVLGPSEATDKYDEIIDLNMCYEQDANRHIIDAYASKVLGVDNLNFDKKADLFWVEKDRNKVDRFISGLELDLDRCVVVHMARTWENRTWHLDCWKEVLGSLVAQQLTPIIIGARTDFTFRMEGVYSLFGCLTIHEVAYLVHRCGCYLSNDSGMLHVAGTTNTPIVGIFTCAKGEFRLPYRHGLYGGNCICIKPNIQCYGCLHRSDKATSHIICERNDNACLDQITPEQVVSAVKHFFRP